MASLTQIKNWFKSGLRPTADQFAAAWDSYWHKDLIIPTNKIQNLDNRLSEKTDNEAFNTHKGDNGAHSLLFNAKADLAAFNNLAALVGALPSGYDTAILGIPPAAGVVAVNVDTAATYPLYGNLVVSAADLDSGLVRFLKKDGVWIKYITSIALGSYLTKIAFEGENKSMVTATRESTFPISGLTAGKTLLYRISAFTAGDDIRFYLYKADGVTFVQVGAVSDVDKTYVLLEDFASVKFYNNTAVRGFTANVSLKGVPFDMDNVKKATTKLNEYFWSDTKVTIPIFWANASSYWNTQGQKIALAGYDISNPIATEGYNYFGYYGQLNEGSTAIVSVTDQNVSTGVVEVGRIPFNANGMSLIIFKTTAAYFSLSTFGTLKPNVFLFRLKAPFLIKLLNEAEANRNAISLLANSLYNDIVYTAAPAAGNMRLLDIVTPSLTKGRSIDYKKSGAAADSNIDFYLFRADGTNVKLSKATTDNIRYVLLEDFVSARFYNIADSFASGFTGTLTIKSVSSSSTVSEEPITTLLLGDSYTAGNGAGSAWVQYYQQAMPTGSSFYSLAVGSCTIRDRFSDRNAYPYTSRPVQANNTGNLNVLACQIEKLKRLMAGVDLDAGEVQLYPNGAYPKVIIIEGAMNDNIDSDAVQATYTAQFTRAYNNVWFKAVADANATQGTIYSKTPMSEVNRTCFAGAYRYVVEELLTLFPSAQIFVTTASRMGYGFTDVNTVRSKQAAQQRICAELLSASVIDWNAEGQINTIVNYPKGAGTEADPFVINVSANTRYTADVMHPNLLGGKLYGRLAAKRVRERYLNI